VTLNHRVAGSIPAQPTGFAREVKSFEGT